MSIRIGSSCVMSLSMALGKVVETRRFYDGFSGWQEVAQNAIKNKQYLIVTPCNHNDKTVKYLNNTQWVNFIDDTCKYLISIGANKYNARISLINEPMKYISREKYADLINLAYPIVKSYGLLCGAGNEEFVTAQARDNMYQYILTNCQFDILDIHIQGSCNSKADTDKWIAEVKSWINYWQKPVDCTEAFYGDIRTQAGYDLLCYQLKKADEIKCPNFCNVFNNLDKSAFPYQDSTDQWHKLCFKINGDIRSVYWVLWMDEIAGSGPEPNIIIEEDDDMKLEVLKVGSKGNQVQWLQEILEIEYGYENEGERDGIFGPKTEAQVKAYQQAQGITVDGIVGKQTTAELINMAIDTFTPDYWMYKLVIYMAYE